jgi:hypothetical protein
MRTSWQPVSKNAGRVGAVAGRRQAKWLARRQSPDANQRLTTGWVFDHVMAAKRRLRVPPLL